MRKPYASRSLRMTAIIIGIMMLAAVLFSSFYIGAEANHTCTGDDCPVCACIQQCETHLRQFSNASFGHAAAPFLPLFLLLSGCILVYLLTQDTLFSQKVRLNN